MEIELMHESSAEQQLAAEGQEASAYGDSTEAGDLLTSPAGVVAKRLTGLWEEQDTLLRAHNDQCTVNALRRQGVPGVRMKVSTNGETAVYIPPNSTGPDGIPGPNKAADICRRLPPLLIAADPPAGDPVPFSDSDDDVAAAEFSARILEENDSDLEEPATILKAFDRASTYRSAFVHYFIDPTGGGRGPLKVKAGFDPATGLEAQHFQEAARTPAGIPWPKFQPRFVRSDGSLTAEEGEAATRWLPKLKRKIYTSRHVRLLPFNCEDIWDADGVLIGDFITWADAKREAPELGELDERKIDALLGYKPKHWQELVSDMERKAMGKAKDERRFVFRLQAYFRQCPAYPKGARVIVLGGRLVSKREAWVFEKPNGQEEALDIPVTQYAQLEEGRPGPYKVSMMEVLGRSNDMLSYVWGLVVQQLERVRNQKVFTPIHARQLAKQLQQRGSRYVPILPNAEPKYEEIPPFPDVIEMVFERVADSMDDASGLQQAARGMQDPSVTSGRQAAYIISQVKQGVSDLLRNIERGYLRGARIRLQLIRKDYRIEQQSLWSGDDDEWKLKAWRSADLGSTRDVKLKPGTGTMMSPAQKEAMAFEWHAQGLISTQRLHEIVTRNIGATLGVEQDPHRSRILRQLAEWADGPPEGWQPPQPQPQVVGVGLDGMPQVTMNPPGPDPVLARIFEPTPADTIPEVAQTRMELIAERMAQKKYLAKPIEWRSALDAEFQRMVAALTPPPAPGPIPAGMTEGSPPATDAAAPATETLAPAPAIA